MDFTQWSNIEALIQSPPSWVGEEDRKRIGAYATYEKIFWNLGETFKVAQRGSDDDPIYVPTGRTIVETTNRYLAPGFGYTVEATGSLKTMAEIAFRNLFDRERFMGKFASNKRYGLIRGDWCWHTVADLTKPPGSRISLYELDPASYFPVYDPDNLDRLLKVHIATPEVQKNGETWIRRLTYEKVVVDGRRRISSAEQLWDLQDWQKGARLKRTVKPLALLPPEITAIPVYHIRNFTEPNSPWGSSEIRGLERIMLAINQAISDQELALALDGLGVYATDAPDPTVKMPDGTEVEIDWEVGPGSVIGIPPQTTFQRVQGVGSVQPSLDHIAYLTNILRESSGTPDAAMGKVDVSVAESGISLLLQLGPMFSKAEEKEIEVLGVHTQMFYDLLTWMSVFDELPFFGADVKVIPTIGSRLPPNRKERFTELNEMLSQGFITHEFWAVEMAKLGFSFPAGMVNDIKRQREEAAQREADLFATRSEEEVLGGEGGDIGAA